jgi:hypothetical protein
MLSPDIPVDAGFVRRGAAKNCEKWISWALITEVLVIKVRKKKLNIANGSDISLCAIFKFVFLIYSDQNTIISEAGTRRFSQKHIHEVFLPLPDIYKYPDSEGDH